MLNIGITLIPLLYDLRQQILFILCINHLIIYYLVNIISPRP